MLFSIIKAWTSAWTMERFFLQTTALALTFPWFPLPFQQVLGIVFGPMYNEIVDIKSVLHQKNSNLSSSQKEVLLWQQQLSHASTNWIQTLMRDRKWLPDTGYPNAALHLGPFIVAKSCAPICDVSNMKCVACLFAKASTQSLPNMAPRPSRKTSHAQI
jgi:hypothetical protein